MAYFHTTVLDEQIKALPTVGTASGSVASFDTDMTENLVGCVCEVASGSSEINVYATGKNIWNGTASPTGTYRSFIIDFFLPAGDYVFSANVTSSDTDGTKSLILLRNVDNGAEYVRLDRNMRSSFAITFTKDIVSIQFYAGYNDIQSVGDTYTFTDLQIEKGSIVSTYEPFGNTYNIPFGETLSGDGSFDVLSGILTRSDDTTKQLSANYIQTINGINNVYCDTGNTEVKYILSVGKAIS